MVFFASLTLKLFFWPWRWPWVIKIIQEMDCPVKITQKWGITLVPGFICWKIIFDLEIFGGHFVFALEEFRPRVPKWHPADSCPGHPLEPESILKHRPYRETRLSKKKSFDNWTIIIDHVDVQMFCWPNSDFISNGAEPNTYGLGVDTDTAFLQMWGARIYITSLIPVLENFL